MLRRGGAFFIRRSFSGDRLYGAVVDAYVRRLIREGFSIEFFLRAAARAPASSCRPSSAS